MEHDDESPVPANPPDADAHDDFWLDEPTDDPHPRRARVSRRNVVVAGVGAVVIAAAAVVGVNAISSGSSATAASSQNGNGPPGRGGPPGGGQGGTISSINGSTIVVKNRNNQTLNVQTSSSTSVTETVKGALSDVKVGDHVVVLGSGSGSTLTAQRIVDNGTASNQGPGGPGGQPPSGSSNTGSGSANGGGPGGSGGPPGGAANGGGPQGAMPTMGTVTAVNGSSITIQTSSGSTVTVSTPSSTTVLVTKSGTVSDLTVGEQIMVRGSSSNGTVTATSIREGDFGPPGGGGSGSAGGPPGSSS